MASTLGQLRERTREHMDLDVVELSNGLLDAFAREASNRVEMHSSRWAFREHVWEFDVTPSVASYPVGNIADPLTDFVARRVHSVWDGSRRLEWLGPSVAEQFFEGRAKSGPLSAWSEWGGRIVFHPAPSEVRSLRVRGVRFAKDWVLGGSGSEPDFPEPFHNTIWLWMLGRAYGQQEDTELSMWYMDLFQDELERLGKDYRMMPPPQPVVLGSVGGGGYRGIGGRLSFPWE